jgi:hypothetical protein
MGDLLSRSGRTLGPAGDGPQNHGDFQGFMVFSGVQCKFHGDFVGFDVMS